jgi:hypothetical protein
MMANVCHVTSGAGRTKFQARLSVCWTECTRGYATRTCCQPNETLSSSVLNMQLNVILLSTRGTTKRRLPFRFFEQKSLLFTSLTS